MPRIDLGRERNGDPIPNLEGQWAELRERISHGQHKEIKRAIWRARQDPELRGDVDTIFVRVFVRDWQVKDAVTNEVLAVPEGGLTDALVERADTNVVKRLLDEAAPLWIGRLDTGEDREDAKAILDPTGRPSPAS